MLTPYIAAFQIGNLQIQSTYTRPTTTIVEVAPELNNPFLTKDELKDIKRPIKPIELPRIQKLTVLKQKPIPKPKVAQRAYTRQGAPAGYYQPGWCTYGAWLLAPWVGEWHNANMWDDYARQDGHTVSPIPIPGSVFVDNGGSLGHVGMVLSVSNGSVTVRDMNYIGFGKWSTRTASASKYVYIYP